MGGGFHGLGGNLYFSCHWLGLAGGGPPRCLPSTLPLSVPHAALISWSTEGQLGCNEESLLGQTVVRVLCLLLGSSRHLLVKLSVNKEPCEVRTPHACYLMTPHPYCVVTQSHLQ